MGVFLIAGSLSAGTARSITGLYTTGSDADSNGFDDHWTRSNDAAAYVVSNANAANNGWYTTPGANWISTTSSGNMWFLGYRTYAYTLTFNITGSPGSNTGDAVTGVSVLMALAVDSSAVIAVNGADLATATGSRQTQNITLNNGFVVGANTITIEVQNGNWWLGSQGLLVSSISGVVPEVGAWLPLAGALALFGWLRLRPKKKFPLAV